MHMTLRSPSLSSPRDRQILRYTAFYHRNALYTTNQYTNYQHHSCRSAMQHHSIVRPERHAHSGRSLRSQHPHKKTIIFSVPYYGTNAMSQSPQTSSISIMPSWSTESGVPTITAASTINLSLRHFETNHEAHESVSTAKVFHRGARFPLRPRRKNRGSSND